MISGGTGDLRSCGNWDAMANPVSHTFSGLVDKHIRWLDVLVYEAVPMDLAECYRQADGNAQEAG